MRWSIKQCKFCPRERTDEIVDVEEYKPKSFDI